MSDFKDHCTSKSDYIKSSDTITTTNLIIPPTNTQLQSRQALLLIGVTIIQSTVTNLNLNTQQQQ
jgi:hypothetical protein